MKNNFREVISIAALAAALLTASACSSDASESDSTATKPDSGSTTSALSTKSTEAIDDCGRAVEAVKKALQNDVVVKTISGDGSCGVDVQTSLEKDPDNVATGFVLCTKASVEAYGAGANSVQVYAVDQQELSISVKGQDCIKSL